MRILSNEDAKNLKAYVVTTVGCSPEEAHPRRTKLEIMFGDVRGLAIFTTVISTFAAMFVGFIELLRYLWRLL